MRTRYYLQFDAHNRLDVPAEGYGGWRVAELPLSLGHTAAVQVAAELVVMHAWETGSHEHYPVSHLSHYGVTGVTGVT